MSFTKLQLEFVPLPPHCHSSFAQVNYLDQIAPHPDNFITAYTKNSDSLNHPICASIEPKLHSQYKVKSIHLAGWISPKPSASYIMDKGGTQAECPGYDRSSGMNVQYPPELVGQSAICKEIQGPAPLSRSIGEILMPPFIKGMQLSHDFYFECVAPLMEREFPDIPYSAGRLGAGSCVLGFDDQRSTDHDWGPQVDLFFSVKDHETAGDRIYDFFANNLPFRYKGYSTHFVDDYLMGDRSEYPIIHRARAFSVDAYFTYYLGFNPVGGVSEIDWLRTPEQSLRTIKYGRIFHDGLSVLQTIKDNLNWYPDDLWYYIMACQWMRIDQEEPFVARCGDAGDELGSRVLAARQVKEIMQLCFYLEKEFAPYTKWFGTAFSRLNCAQRLEPLLKRVFMQKNWTEREKILSKVYLILAELHNDLSITEPIEPKISNFHDRPYRVPHSERFCQALIAKVKSPRLKSMERPIGSVNQFTDSTDISCWTGAQGKIASVYDSILNA